MCLNLTLKVNLVSKCVIGTVLRRTCHVYYVLYYAIRVTCITSCITQYVSRVLRPVLRRTCHVYYVLYYAGRVTCITSCITQDVSRVLRPVLRRTVLRFDYFEQRSLQVCKCKFSILLLNSVQLPTKKSFTLNF